VSPSLQTVFGIVPQINVTHLGERWGALRVCMRKPGERANLKDVDVDKRIILKWVFKK
jgi:hypothetical protein